MEMNYNAPTAGDLPIATGESLSPGSIIATRFRIESLTGQGGLGQLYRTLDMQTNRTVAVRIFNPVFSDDEATQTPLRDHIKNASMLQHKNITSVYGMGKDGQLHYMVMEYIEGQSLRQFLDKKRRSGKAFSLKGAYNVLAHICNALQHAYQNQKMAHGLPAPGMVLINKVGRIKVCEFGTIPAILPQTAILERMGDRSYLSPEVRLNPQSISPTSDLYTLGVLLYELLTGRLPPPNYVPPSRFMAGLPPAVDEVVQRCLSPDSSQRYTTPEQLKVAFYAAIQDVQNADIEGSMNSSPNLLSPSPNASSPMLSVPQPIVLPNGAPPSAHSNNISSAPPTAGMGIGAGGPVSAPQSVPSILNAPSPQMLSLDQMILKASEYPAEKWLIQKDRLDFGPFTLSELMKQMSQGNFTGDDMVLDQETGERNRIRTHPLFRQFTVVVERHLEAERHAKAQAAQSKKDKQRRTFFLAMAIGGIVLLGIGGTITAYLLTKKPKIETRERIVYKEKSGLDENKLLKGIEITWKAEPADQALQRKKLKAKRPKAKGAEGDDVAYLGDATKEGGDSLLSQSVVQNVMQTNFNKLAPCVYEEVRRSPSTHAINIDFSIRGSGTVSSIAVNGKSSGPLYSCISSRMQRIKFPSFDGSLTRASFSLTLK